MTEAEKRMEGRVEIRERERKEKGKRDASELL